MAFVGMDHGTTGVSFSIMDEDIIHFKIGREETSSGAVSAVSDHETSRVGHRPVPE